MEQVFRLLPLRAAAYNGCAMSTPMRQQYLDLKRQYPGTILLFRLGDFYETFDDDALVVSQVCEITLTSRPVGKDVRVPLAGVPYHAVDTYVARLVKAGHRVAIAEQSDSGDRSLMQRQVVRVITPGTVTEEFLLHSRSSNYLAAVATSREAAALAYAEASTGEFVAELFPGGDQSAVEDALARVRPAECVVADSDAEAAALVASASVPVARVEGWRVSPERAREALSTHFGTASLAPFGIEDSTETTIAAALCLLYLQETRPEAAACLGSLRLDTGERYLYLDQTVQRNLELVEGPRAGDGATLLSVLDLTQTPMGARLLSQRLLKPLRDPAAISHRLDGVQSLFAADASRSRLRDVLKQMPDLERLAARLVQGTATPRHLLALSQASTLSQRIVSLAAEISELHGEAAQAVAGVDPCAEVAALVNAAIAEDAPATVNSTGIVRPGYSTELDAIVELATNAHQVLAGLETEERQRTGIRNLKVGHNNVFGYYIEVPTSQAERVPADYVRKQTLAGGERYFTEKLKAIEASIYSAQERRLATEKQIWSAVLAEVARYAERLHATARSLAMLDVQCALSEVARRNEYRRPEVNDGTGIAILAGRHPVVEQHLRRQGKAFVPNGLHLSTGEEAILVITGPNMAGKSTYLRQAALIVLMAQMGSFVPAESAQIGAVDRIFTRIGAQDELAAGQSTFMVEMVEVATILRQATPRSLLILDEVGRGTSTYDGMAIARAVVEHIHNSAALGCRTLFATHYHELTDLEAYLPRVRNYSVAVAEEANDVVFLHRIVRGGADRSYGIHVAKLAGVPREVLDRATDVLSQLESQRQQPTAAPATTPSARQLALFSSSTDQMLSELCGIDPNALTPLEALVQLSRLRERAQNLKKGADKPRRS